LQSITKVAAVCIVAAFILIACSENQSPVQNAQQGDYGYRTQVLPKTTNTILGTLNPGSDPGGNCYASYTSGGYNQPVAWVNKSYDLSAYANKNVRIVFHFITGDGLYNRHEGWYLDDINIGGVSDDIEGGTGAWTTTGFWHVSTVRSASGTHSWRYADAQRGTYQAGEVITNDCADMPNSGTLTSAVIGLGANPTLTFNTAWAIESVNPRGFDLMQIEVEEVGVLPAAIDVKPGGCPNPLNMKAGGTLPVAILGSSGFDVTDVDVSTVKLAGVMNGPQAPLAGDVGTPYGMMPMDCMDCNAAGADGFMDWTFYFANQDVASAIEPVDDGDCHVVELTGRLAVTGAYFAGYDVLKIIKK
ncbi:MAG: immune inhibitor A, partial [Bacteroidota bacterium]|nr:immune inhibitor A [Bacteroidota bacterium]